MTFKYYFNVLLSCIALVSLASCKTGIKHYVLTVENDSDVVRNNESIEVWFNNLDFPLHPSTNWIIRDASGNQVNTQFVDANQDSVLDYLVFQSSLNPSESKQFTIVSDAKEKNAPENKIAAYSKFVPERMDDFAWENDKVAFRTYGPECQRLFENKDPTGLISSGIDCWLKKVDYPILDKWYTNSKNGISYHEDHGEGLDNYHVGTTRGCGGTALLCGDNAILSKNFISYKIIANGPIRTVFELEYAPVEACGNSVKETKRITLDLGSDFYQCIVYYASNNTLTTALAGITLHRGAGEVKSNTDEAWISYWEPMGDSFLGTAIIVNTSSVTGYNLDTTIHKDESLNNISINNKLINNSFSYWSGFGWKKRGQFLSHDQWANYLKQESFKKNNPIKKKITKN